MKKKIKKLLLALFLVLWCGILTLELTAQDRKTDFFQQQVDAAEKMSLAMSAIGSYKQQLNIAKLGQDTFDTWMLGEEFNEITTTLGNLPAKRTTANPNMASLMVRLFYEAGLQKGDRVAMGFSGSFPSMNIAALAAAEAMELDAVVISSVGASTYGANNPQLSFPEMLDMLYHDNLVAYNSALVTAGGDYDIGVNMNQLILDEIILRIKERGLNFYTEKEYSTNVSHKIQLIGDIDSFIAVGGNITVVGKGEFSLNLPQGVVYADKIDASGDDTGLIGFYLSQGKNAINIINIKMLTASYGITFDPISIEEIGVGAVYYQKTYEKWIAVVLLILVVFFALAIFRLRKLEGKKNNLNRKNLLGLF